MTRFVIADASAQSRSAMRLLLEQRARGTSVEEVASCQACLDVLARDAPDVLLLDWRIPCAALDQLVTDLRRAHPKLLIIALSARPEDRAQALAAGAHTFISKVDAPDTLLSSLDGV
jgi:CheY-like chemotaxis protein